MATYRVVQHCKDQKNVNLDTAFANYVQKPITNLLFEKINKRKITVVLTAQIKPQ